MIDDILKLIVLLLLLYWLYSKVISKLNKDKDIKKDKVIDAEVINGDIIRKN